MVVTGADDDRRRLSVHICRTCGTSYPAAEVAPESCPLCEDERQYVPRSGQAWTTPEAMRRDDYRNAFSLLEPGLIGMKTVPAFAIGQQAHLIRTSEGNFLWDAVSLVDDVTLEILAALGGVQAMAVSHPHFFSSMASFAEAFDAPCYIGAADADWIVRPSRQVVQVEGEALTIFGGLTLIVLGGHFPGSLALHWAGGAGGTGALFGSDTVTVAQDRKSVSFMKSFPNNIPLSANEVRRIARALSPYPFTRIYGGWAGAVIESDAQTAVARSVERYIRAVEPGAPDPA